VIDPNVNSGFNYRIVIAVILLSIIVVLSYKHLDQHLQLQKEKYDLAELDSIAYGLFSANAWSKQIAAVLNKKIDEIEISSADKEAYEAVIVQILDQLIKETDRYIKRRNQINPDDSLMVSIKKSMKQEATDVLIDFEDIRRNALPQLSTSLLETLQETQTRRQIKAVFSEKFDRFTTQNFDQINFSRIERIDLQYNCTDKDVCKEKLREKIDTVSDQLHYMAGSILFLTGLLFFVLLFRCKVLSKITFLLLMLATLVLLFLGVLTPMIEIEAQINSFRFMLDGEAVLFSNQILFFQSKSIVDVIRMLIQTAKIDMIVVALLIGIFSILFPLLKVMASVVYIGSWHGWHQNMYIKFFALYSGKWSMADVMVVAMFMAFIGLDGMVSHQLDGLEVNSQNLDLLTYNGTGLEPGFYLFLGFVLFSMLISSKIRPLK